MAEETTSCVFESDKQQSELIIEAFQKKTRVVKRVNFCGLHEENRKRSKKKHWKPAQNFRYFEFLKLHGYLFERDREDKRVMKINVMMSKFIRTKSSTQCRSHHQKMELHYKSIQGIINYLQQEFRGQSPSQQEQLPKSQPQVEEEANERPTFFDESQLFQSRMLEENLDYYQYFSF